MTTATPRVRVMLAEGGFRDGREYRDYAVLCDYHGWITRARQWSPAMIAVAHRHAATCPALRLARLVRELEALRDEWHQTADAARHERGEWWRGARGAMRVHASQISAVLARAAGASA